MKGKSVRNLFVPAALVVMVLFCGSADGAESGDAYERLLEKYADVLTDIKTEEVQEEDGVIMLPDRHAPAAPAAPADGSAAKRPGRDFTSGYETARIICRAGMVTDIELEPGERVERYVVSDPARWSVSAAWSGEFDDLVTHVLIRTQFPGLKMNMMIFTDRRMYSLDVTSSETAAHTPRVTFNYLKLKNADEEEEIPPGKWRDLLERYDILAGARESSGSGETDSQNLIDGADIYFEYVITPRPKDRRKIEWLPVAVYDANGFTYIVMPKNVKFPGAHTLEVERGGSPVRVTYDVARKDLYVVGRLFDLGILSHSGDRVEIRRRDPVGQ